MTIALKIGFIATCIVSILAGRLMRDLMPTWPEGGSVIAMGLWALVTTLWVEHWLGITRKRWLITWGTVTPVVLVMAWVWR